MEEEIGDPLVLATDIVADNVTARVRRGKGTYMWRGEGGREYGRSRREGIRETGKIDGSGQYFETSVNRIAFFSSSYCELSQPTLKLHLYCGSLSPPPPPPRSPLIISPPRYPALRRHGDRLRNDSVRLHQGSGSAGTPIERGKLRSGHKSPPSHVQRRRRHGRRQCEPGPRHRRQRNHRGRRGRGWRGLVGYRRVAAVLGEAQLSDVHKRPDVGNDAVPGGHGRALEGPLRRAEPLRWDRRPRGTCVCTFRDLKPFIRGSKWERND